MAPKSSNDNSAYKSKIKLDLEKLKNNQLTSGSAARPGARPPCRRPRPRAAYVYTYIFVSLSLSMYICMCIYIYIYK